MIVTTRPTFSRETREDRKAGACASAIVGLATAMRPSSLTIPSNAHSVPSATDVVQRRESGFLYRCPRCQTAICSFSGHVLHA